jgi:hypothetical protein
MPILPSGRRVEFSLDRFHVLLKQADALQAELIVEALHDPDDLLYVLDAVHFSLDDGAPFFAGYVAADWTSYAAEWSNSDRQAFQFWIDSNEVRSYREDVIDFIKARMADNHDGTVSYPYLMASELSAPVSNNGTAFLQ